MFENYRYFIMLAEEKNVTQAAKKLFITHQALSRYLSHLEKECQVVLFYRKPTFRLTPEGEEFLKTVRVIQSLEQNLTQRYTELRNGNTGTIRVGITEGRFRIFMPSLIKRYSKLFPAVQLLVTSARPAKLEELLLNNRLDMAIMGATENPPPSLHREIILNERIYVIVSDNMLRNYFPSRYPECITDFQEGIDLKQLLSLPFASNLPSANSTRMVEQLTRQLHINLHYIHTSNHPDLHHILTSQDYVASFCLSMYLPNIKVINSRTSNHLFAFPIKGLYATNPVVVEYRKERIFPTYGKALLRLIKSQCYFYASYSSSDI